MKISIKKDGEGYLAEIVGKKNIYAFGYTQEEAFQELGNVVDMMLEHFSEEVKIQKSIKTLLVNKSHQYAI